jgi:phosphatidylserine decarboxylase
MPVKLDSDGHPFIAAAAVPAGLAALAGQRRLVAGLLVLPLAVAAFFRDPDRGPDDGTPVPDDLLVSPADGKVMHVGVPQEGVAPDGEWQQVAIFLSLADVHINRAPYGGRVTEVTYRPGRFLAAFKAESALENERSEITVERTVHGITRRIVFRQIVGLLARRVVTRVAPGDEIATGERIGLMKFGSRMDVFLPARAEILVHVGPHVVAGETVLARLLPVTGA